VVSEIQESLEWRSVLDAVVDIKIWAALPTLNASGVMAYTDGACIKNPGGPAGWSALLWAMADVINTEGGKVREGAPCLECYGHIPKAPTATNNRAEIAAVLAVLSLAPPTLPLHIYSDSDYTIKVAQGIYQMKANQDLWELYRKLLSYRKQPPSFTWVRGHVGQEHNERADELAGLGAFNGDMAAYRQWQASQTPEAHNTPSSAELVAMQRQVQKLHAYFQSLAPDNPRVSAKEREFITDMVKRLQKGRFVPTPKQSNWVHGLVKKYEVK
jgi:ribonuclease HI